MSEATKLLETIEAFHAVSLGTGGWSKALSAAARLFDSEATTFERFAPASGSLFEYHSFGVPPSHELDYLDHYAAINPRAAFGIRNPLALVQWDYQNIDEATMERDTYYAEFLPKVGLRYYISAQVRRTSQEMVVLSVQRTPQQGHVGKGQIALMRRLLPHVRQAIDVADRLKSNRAAHEPLEAALEWLADGVALISADGTVLFANPALAAIARQQDGVSLARGTVTFATPIARARFQKALAILFHGRTNDSTQAGLQDFPVARPSQAPSYMVSLRPLARSAREIGSDQAIAILFVRDPLRRSGASADTLREIFGLTDAEANLARALQAGTTLAEYARQNAISPNTVYTHLRRIREKTGSHRLGALLRKLNELEAPALASPADPAASR